LVPDLLHFEHMTVLNCISQLIAELTQGNINMFNWATERLDLVKHGIWYLQSAVIRSVASASLALIAGQTVNLLAPQFNVASNLAVILGCHVWLKRHQLWSTTSSILQQEVPGFASSRC